MDIRRLVWEGSIPLEISLNDPEGILCETSTLPFYMMVRRLLYFPLLVTEIKRHFGSISRTIRPISSFSSSRTDLSSHSDDFGGPEKDRSMASMNTTNFYWFTCKFGGQNLVIPPHLPVGLLYDILDGTDLPWRIEFHISAKEGQQPLEGQNYNSYNNNNNNNNSSNNNNNNNTFYYSLIDEQQLSSIYFSSLKEADYLRSGSAKNVMNLSRSEQLQLLESLRGGDFDKFWRINQKLLSPSNAIKNLPIRFWVLRPSSSGLFDKIQFLIGAEGSADVSLKSLLESEFTVNIKCVICQGVELPVDRVSLRELALNWGHADNFINLLLIT